MPNRRAPGYSAILRAMTKKAQTVRHYRRFFWQLAVVMLVLAALGLAWLDAMVRHRFDAHQWQLPARVYARPVELYVGQPLEDQHLERLLGLMRYQRITGAPLPGSFERVGNGWHLHSRSFSGSDGGERAQHIRLRVADDRVVSLRDGQGAALPLARLEPLQVGSIHPGHSEDRVLVRLEEVPSGLSDLLLAVEDQGFHSHHGISLRGMTRALVSNLRSGSVRQGGSTLTQQLVKNFWLTRERTFSRKLIEIPMAILLELHYSKEQILETYLNEVYLGQDGRRAIHGMGLAANFWFGRPLQELEVHQFALLVGMLQGPSLYDPRRRPERARARRDTVLQVGYREGLLDQRQLQAALARPLDVVPVTETALYAFPAFVDLVRRQLARDYSPGQLSSDGLIIHSTLDVLAQLAAEQALARGLLAQDPDGQRQLNGALVITSPEQGDVLAVVGDRLPRSGGFNRALDALRPIGSLAKPPLVLAALEQPRRYHLATLVEDEPIELTMANGDIWAPGNFDGQSLGPLPLLRVLTESRNQAIAHLGTDMGLEPFVAMLRRLGVQRDLPRYPSMLLGSLELSPFEVAVMYQTLASGGFRTPLRAITDVLDHNGRPVARYPVSVQQVVEPDVAWLLQWAMMEVLDNGTGRHVPMPEGFRAAGKTGTSDGNRDGWFAGFTGSHLAVVWVGRDDNQPARVGGSFSALPIWRDAMTSVPQRPLNTEPPAGIEWVWMDADGQRRSGPDCDDARRYPMLVASIPEASNRCGRASESQGGVRGWLRRWFD